MSLFTLHESYMYYISESVSDATHVEDADIWQANSEQL